MGAGLLSPPPSKKKKKSTHSINSDKIPHQKCWLFCVNLSSFHFSFDVLLSFLLLLHSTPVVETSFCCG